MGKVFGELTAELEAWLKSQHIFFVATAPLAANGLVNCSPKGLDTFRVLGPNEVAYLDLTGSGIETVAHLSENGRIVLMFCAFAGPPRIVRLHCEGTVLTPESAGYRDLRLLFPELPGARAIIRARLTRISDSCGYAVPVMDYIGNRDILVKGAERKGPEGLARYRKEKNGRSLDGLPGLR